MGRGGAKLGKEVKGAGHLDEASRVQLVGAHAAPVDNDMIDEDVAETADDLIQRRDTMLTNLRSQLTGEGGRHYRQCHMKWRAIMRQAMTRALGAKAIAVRFDLDRRRVFRAIYGDELLGAITARDSIALRAAQYHAGQVQELIQVGFTLPFSRLAILNDSVAERQRASIEAEHSQIGRAFTDAQRKLDAALADVQAARALYEDDATAKAEMEREQIRGDNLEAINELRVALDRVVEDLEQRFDAAHAAYLQSTAERARDFRDLHERDVTLAADISRKLARVDSAASEIARWRKKVTSNAAGAQQRNDAIRREHRSLQSQFFALKATMTRARDNQSVRTRAMAVRGRHARRQIDLRLRQAHRILRLADIVSLDTTTSPCQARDDHLHEVVMTRLGELQLERQRLGQKRHYLREENTKLKEALRAFVEAVGISPGTIDQNNALVIVNGKHNLVRPSSLSPGALTSVAVDAGVVARRYDLQKGVLRARSR